MSNLHNKAKNNAVSDNDNSCQEVTVLPPQQAAEVFPLGVMGDLFPFYMRAWSLEQWNIFRTLTAPNVWAKRKIFLDSIRQDFADRFHIPIDVPDYILDEVEQIVSCNAPCGDCDGSVCLKSQGFKYAIDTFKLREDDQGYDVQKFVTTCKKRSAFLEKQRLADFIRRNTENAGIPKRYSDSLFSDFIRTGHNATAYRCALHLADVLADKGLFISGPPGVGKTFLLSILANALLKKAHTVVFYTVPVFLRSIKATFESNSAVSTDQLCRSVSDVPVLFLDDFGAERMSEWASEQLFNIVNSRYESMLPTFFSSNFDLQELKAKMSIDPKTGYPSDSLSRNAARLASRIQSMCHICSIIDDDWRSKI